MNKVWEFVLFISGPFVLLAFIFDNAPPPHNPIWVAVAAVAVGFILLGGFVSAHFQGLEKKLDKIYEHAVENAVALRKSVDAKVSALDAKVAGIRTEVSNIPLYDFPALNDIHKLVKRAVEKAESIEKTASSLDVEVSGLITQVGSIRSEVSYIYSGS